MTAPGFYFNRAFDIRRTGALRRSLPIALLIGFVAPALARDDYARVAALDVLHYRISLALKHADRAISGETAIQFAVRSGPIKEISLDFEGLTVDSVTETSSFPASGVTSGEGTTAATFNHSAGKLKVTLTGQYRTGNKFALLIRYHGVPRDGLFIKKNKFGDWTAFADNWPNRAHYWFPSIDHPYDKATAEFVVDAPARWGVVANGALMNKTELGSGSRRWHWRIGVPIPVYCMVVGAADFAVVDAGSWNGIPVSFYLYPRDREAGIKDYGRAVKMLEFFANLIGPYPYEKLALVQSSTRFGGMENSSTIFFDEMQFNGSGKLEGTVSHEIAHQWFGDSVTEADWHHLWLSEGFATYFGHLFFERMDGRQKFRALMQEDKRTVQQFNRPNARPIVDPSITDLFQLLNGNNYQKGGWVLHMLRRLLGDEKFFAGIRDYYRTHRDGNAMTADLQREMEKQYGRPLDWFFRQWVMEPGYPVYDADWSWNQPGKQIKLTVRQKQSGTVFRMPIDIDIRLASGSRREVIEVREREQTFTFNAGSRPLGIAIDPDEWILKDATINGR